MTLHLRLEHRLGIDPNSRPGIYARLDEAADPRSLNYWLELFFAAGIATLGLVLNSPAVVIGAMLISPLMGPILASGLALLTGDLILGAKALGNLIASTVLAVSFSALLVWALPFHSPTSEILARTRPNLLDLGIALLSGLAGSIVFCRSGSGGGITALPGVAIAVALMPPLCTVGFGVGSGFDSAIISGALLLFVTNLVAISATAFFVFLGVGMQRVHPLYGAERTPGRLALRVGAVLVLLLALYWPLRQALQTLKTEASARIVARDVTRKLVGQDAIVSESVDIGPERIAVRLVATTHVDPDRIRRAEATLQQRVGKTAVISVRRLASDSDLAVLRDRMNSPKPAPAPAGVNFRDLSGLAADVVPFVDEALQALWPAGFAVKGQEVGFDAKGPIVRVQYESRSPVDPAAAEVVGNALRSKLGSPELRFVAEFMAPVKPPARRKAK